MSSMSPIKSTKIQEAPSPLSDKQSSPLIARRQAKRTMFRPFAKVTPFICAFCGGKTCKHENWLTQQSSAIKGLNSDWITDNILACQRPSSRIIAEHDIIGQFKAKGISAILNLQEPGEHPHCGDGIHQASGFSYHPEEFYKHDIYFFNFGWRDMTATSTDIILKILKQMSFILSNGEKIAVHCHAGRGRTGLIIAAWLIYNDQMTAKEAIQLVRLKRKDAISKKSQEVVLHQLEKEIKGLRMIFMSNSKLGLGQYISNQKRLVPLSSVSEEKYVSKIVSVTLERLELLINSKISSPKQVFYAFYSLNESTIFEAKWDAQCEKTLKSIKDRINNGDYHLSDIEDPRYLTQILLDFFDSFTSPAIGPLLLEVVSNRFIGGSTKFTESTKEALFKEVDKKELFLLEALARLFSLGLNADRKTNAGSQEALMRLCISLLLRKNKHEKGFVRRDLVKLSLDDEKVSKLKVFMQHWIDYFDNLIRNPTMASMRPSGNHTNNNGTLENEEKPLWSNTLLGKTIERHGGPEYYLIRRPSVSTPRRSGPASPRGSIRQEGGDDSSLVGSYFVNKSKFHLNLSQSPVRAMESHLRVNTYENNQDSESNEVRPVHEEVKLPELNNSKSNLYSPIKSKTDSDKGATIQPFEIVEGSAKKDESAPLNISSKDSETKVRRLSQEGMRAITPTLFKAQIKKFEKSPSKRADNTWSDIEKLGKEEQEFLLGKMVDMFEKRGKPEV